MPRFHKFIYHRIIRPLRLTKEAKFINRLPGETVLEVGYFDDSFKKLLISNKTYMGLDPAPFKLIENMPQVRIEDFKTNKKFDIVVASNILEHVEDPVSAIKKIKSLSKKYVCIAVPYEPFYTISRFFVPEKEHYWTIHPNILKHYLGKPIFENFMHLRRSYFAIYVIK
jgi:hypothetical protein